MEYSEIQGKNSENQVYIVSARWSTWSGMTDEEMKVFEKLGHEHLIKNWLSKEDRYIFQLEKGEETERLHYQIFCGLKNKKRTKTLAITLNEKFKGIEISACSTQGKEALATYCMKPEKIAGPWSDKPIPKNKHLKLKLWPWQIKIEEILKEEADDRTIMWICDKQGGNGKTMFSKYLIGKYKAGYSSWAKTSDILNNVSKNMGRSIYIFDLTKMKPQDFGKNDIYSAMEQIKNGIVCNTKYECSTKLMDSPHVLIFSNQMPELTGLSADRWKIWNLENKGLKA